MAQNRGRHIAEEEILEQRQAQAQLPKEKQTVHIQNIFMDL